jgi:hypothetical protein
MTGIFQQIAGWPNLYDSPRIHDGGPMGALRDDSQIMGNEEEAHAEFFLKAVNQFKNLGLNGNIKGCCRFVGDQKFWPARESHGDHDPLAHPATQLMGIVVAAGCRGRDADAMEHLDGFFPRVTRAETAVEPKSLRNLFANAEDRIQRGHRFLEYHGDSVATDATHFLVG